VEHIGPYSLEKRVAVGGMGEVWLATLTRDGGFQRRVALKLLLPQYADDADFARQFEAEARLAGLLHHRHIVPVIDFGRAGDRIYLAMEWVDGLDLRAVMKRVHEAQRRLPFDVVFGVSIACAEGLDYAQTVELPGMPEGGIVHRDISPSNILISLDGDVRLIDFGLARPISGESIAHQGDIKGKFSYMSPEQSRGERVDGRTDIFGLGACIYEMVTGEAPYGLNLPIHELIRKISRAEFMAVERKAPWVPPQLAEVIHFTMEAKREARAPTGRAVADLLIRAARTLGLDTGTGPVREVVRFVRNTKESDPLPDSLAKSVHAVMEAHQSGAPSPLLESTIVRGSVVSRPQRTTSERPAVAEVPGAVMSPTAVAQLVVPPLDAPHTQVALAAPLPPPHLPPGVVTDPSTPRRVLPEGRQVKVPHPTKHEPARPSPRWLLVGSVGTAVLVVGILIGVTSRKPAAQVDPDPSPPATEIEAKAAPREDTSRRPVEPESRPAPQEPRQPHGPEPVTAYLATIGAEQVRLAVGDVLVREANLQAGKVTIRAIADSMGVQVEFKSETPVAVQIDGAGIGNTPVTKSLQPDKAMTAVFVREGRSVGRTTLVFDTERGNR